MQYGNKDIEKKHDLSKIKGLRADRFIVRHFNHISLGDGQKIEDPTTSRIQVYDQQTFEAMSRMGEHYVNGKQVQTQSQFQQAGLNVDVLHDPTEEAGTGEGGGEVLKKVGELVIEIESASSPEEVDAIVGKDVRPGVLKAAEKKKASFA